MRGDSQTELFRLRNHPSHDLRSCLPPNLGGPFRSQSSFDCRAGFLAVIVWLQTVSNDYPSSGVITSRPGSCRPTRADWRRHRHSSTDTGLPLAGVRVAVTPADPSIADSVLESLGLTDSTGRYRLENVSPGRYNILVGRRSQSRYHPGVTELSRATTIQVVAGSTIEVPDMVFAGRERLCQAAWLTWPRARAVASKIWFSVATIPSVLFSERSFGGRYGTFYEGIRRW